MKFFVGFAIIFFFILFSCSDTADPLPMVGIDEKLLVNTNGWAIESSIKDDGNAKKNLFALYAACIADNAYKFKSDGTYTIDEGKKKCDTTNQQIKEAGEWMLSGSSLTLSPVGDVPSQFTVSSLTVNQLVFTYLEIGSRGVVSSITTTTFKPLTNL